MKRFIDLTNVEDVPGQFAWWDTVSDTFDSYDGEVVFSDWADFEAAYRAEYARNLITAKRIGLDDIYPNQIERYRGLAPEWTGVRVSVA